MGIKISAEVRKSCMRKGKAQIEKPLHIEIKVLPFNVQRFCHQAVLISLGELSLLYIFYVVGRTIGKSLLTPQINVSYQCDRIESDNYDLIMLK